MRIGRARKNNRINSTHSWLLAGRSRPMPASRESAIATSRLHPERCSDGYKPVQPDRRRSHHCRLRRRRIRRYARYFPVRLLDSVAAEMAVSGLRDAARAFCDPRGRYLSALSSRRAVKGPPLPFLSLLIFTRRWLIPFVSRFVARDD